MARVISKAGESGRLQMRKELSSEMTEMKFAVNHTENSTVLSNTTAATRSQGSQRGQGGNY